MTPDERLARREVTVGRGVALKLQDLRGVERVRITEYGGELHGAAMLPGSAFVEVWTTADRQTVLEHVERHRPAGVMIVAIARRARARDRLTAWVRWNAWRMRSWWRARIRR